MYSSILDGILFVEGVPEGARTLKHLHVTLSGFGSQLKTLDDLKRRLASDARRAGANAVVDFKYGQKSSWWSIDQVKWQGSGIAAQLPADVVSQFAGSH